MLENGFQTEYVIRNFVRNYKTDEHTQFYGYSDLKFSHEKKLTVCGTRFVGRSSTKRSKKDDEWHYKGDNDLRNDDGFS